jgi:chromosome segregation ATPase
MPEFDDDESPTRPRWSTPTETDYKALIRALDAKITTLVREKAELEATNAALRSRVEGLQESVASLNAQLQLTWEAAQAAERRARSAEWSTEIPVTVCENETEPRRK